MRRIQHVTSYDLAAHALHTGVEELRVSDHKVDYRAADPERTTSEQVIATHPAVLRYVQATHAAQTNAFRATPLSAPCPDCENTGWVTDRDGNGDDCRRCAG